MVKRMIGAVGHRPRRLEQRQRHYDDEYTQSFDFPHLHRRLLMPLSRVPPILRYSTINLLRNMPIGHEKPISLAPLAGARSRQFRPWAPRRCSKESARNNSSE
jgi:hypothetical protein